MTDRVALTSTESDAEGIEGAVSAAAVQVWMKVRSRIDMVWLERVPKISTA
jgi:hypothetical protein